MAIIHCTNCAAENEGTIEHRFLKNPADVYDKTAVVALGRAVAAGDIAEVAICLDIVFRNDAEIREWIEQGRRQ
jgi:hypothetical protein